MVGAAPVAPTIVISAMLSNTARVTAFRRSVDLRRVVVALAVALPACALGAWIYTLLTGRGAALVIGTTLIATVPAAATRAARFAAWRKGLSRRCCRRVCIRCRSMPRFIAGGPVTVARALRA
jgi:hypothetical protein